MSDELLLHSVELGDLELVSCLIEEAGANVNYSNVNNTTPILMASRKGNIGIIELLLEHKADPNVKENPNIGGNSPLHYAVLEHSEKCVETLLNHFCNPNIQNSFGFTPLHLGAREGVFTIVELLLNKGANPNILDNGGKTASFWAQEYKFYDVLKILPKFSYNWRKHIENKKNEIVFIRKSDSVKKNDNTTKKKVKKKK